MKRLSYFMYFSVVTLIFINFLFALGGLRNEPSDITNIFGLVFDTSFLCVLIGFWFFTRKIK